MDDLGLVRARTADLHRRVEDALDLPGSARSLSDYVALLERFIRPARTTRTTAGPTPWSSCWAELGPTTFLAGDGRLRARGWQAVRAALRRADDTLTEDVVRGARAVFAAFEVHLSAPAAVGRLAAP